MEYKNLGRTGLKVSRFCLGTFNFYHATSEEEAFSLLDKAEEVGINFIDTVNIYGKEKRSPGAAESLIGKWLHKEKSRRNNLVISTKVFGPTGEGPNQRGLSAYHIRKACEDSLRRLKTDHIDLYQMHHIDRDTPWEEIWQAFEILVHQGKVLYIGSSNFAAWQIVKAQCMAEKRNLLGLVSEQSIYNLMERTVELEVIPAVRDFGLGFLPWSPLAGGLLAGIFKKAKTGRRSLSHKQEEILKARNSLEQYDLFCKKINAKPAHVAIAWLLTNEAVTASIIGARNADQLEDNLQAFHIHLGKDKITQLEQIWPCPGGEAPEAYAKWGKPR